MADLSAVHEFLPCPTPDARLENALAHQPLMLIDHANCENGASLQQWNLWGCHVA